MNFFLIFITFPMSERIGKTLLVIEKEVKTEKYTRMFYFLETMYLKNFKKCSVEYDKFVIMAQLLEIIGNDKKFVGKLLSSLKFDRRFFSLFERIGYEKVGDSYIFKKIRGQGYNIQNWYAEYERSDVRGLYYLLLNRVEKLEQYFVLIGTERFCEAITNYKIRNKIIKNKKKLNLVTLYKIVIERALHDMCFESVQVFIIFLCKISSRIRRLEQQRKHWEKKTF